MIVNMQETLKKHGLWLKHEIGGQKADLSGANLRRANLRWANLSRADLRQANLRWANLSEADLRRADLRWANLSRANLSEANLSEANLSEANLSEANLSGADLRWANLSGADLNRAGLSKADLSKADLRRADLSKADLYGTCLDPKSSVSDWIRAQGLRVTGRGVVAYRTKVSQHVGSCIYEPGKTYRAARFSTDTTTPCHPGLYVAGLKWLRENYPHASLVKVYFRLVDGPVVAEDKGRVRAFRVLCDVDEDGVELAPGLPRQEDANGKVGCV